MRKESNKMKVARPVCMAGFENKSSVFICANLLCMNIHNHIKIY